jgi:hypothetical protein
MKEKEKIPPKKYLHIGKQVLLLILRSGGRLHPIGKYRQTSIVANQIIGNFLENEKTI